MRELSPVTFVQIAVGVLAGALVVGFLVVKGCGDATIDTKGTLGWTKVGHAQFDIPGATHVQSITLRLEVPGGWIYRTTTGKHNALVFVPEASPEAE